MLTLHYAPDNASLIVRLALLELGVPFATTLVDRRARQQDSAAYRALNPAGLIPVLETPEGPISETAAVLLWLVDRYGALGPQVGAPGRGAFLKWLFFASNTLHADLRMVFYPGQYAPGAEAALIAGVTARMRRHYALLDDLCGTVPWFGGETPSVLDFYVAVTLRWAPLYGPDQAWFTFTDLPKLHAMVKRLEQRPSVITAIVAEGLGPHPFINPQPCTPPEGTPT